MSDRLASLLCLAVGVLVLGSGASAAEKRPNVLLAISDDQSWIHASAYGYGAISTPAFDRVAQMGVLFNQAFAASPGCSPCRAALLTGRQTWQIEHAGTHASSFSAKYVTYPDLLEASGYFVGMTGKGWGPGNWKDSGRTRNPAGPDWGTQRTKPPHQGISSNDYAANFRAFLADRPKDKPFAFWYGGSEPHRVFEKGVGLKVGKKLEDIVVPGFLPDTPEIRSDIADYLVEIEWFDQHLGQMLKALEEIGELENTLIIVTSDNGMAFPRAKANCYEYGIRMPLAISWPARVPGGRVVDDLVGFVDLTATMLEAAGVEHPGRGDASLAPAGRSIMNILTAKRGGVVDASRTMVFSARERHSSSRYENAGYPMRAVRTQEYLYIRNFHPDRWPAGDPQVYDKQGTLSPMHGGYHDIDACPSLTFLVENADHPKWGRYLQLSVAKRPAEELFDIRTDPECLNNLAGDPAHAKVRSELAAALEHHLRQTGDPRMGPNAEIWETYPRYSHIRTFPAPGR